MELPIDWATVNWSYVIVLSLIVFVCTLVGSFLSFRRIFRGAVITTLLFAAAYVFWTYYPHGLPLSTKAQEAVPTAPAPPKPATAGTPMKPDNPVTTISPPPNSEQR
jgi:uncharacterized membrane protein YfcA